jgi:hemoglobin/transferrin/lactoferrin receptor protein
MMRSMWGVLAALVPSLAVIAPGAHAQSIQLDELAVTARGYETPLSETPGSIAVVTAEDIALSKKDSVADVLAGIPGVAASGDSPWGRDISIRGMTGTSVVILIDGKRINTATDINARLGLINPSDVERIEVLKGPISALYGSGSTGGVVNIITRKGKFTSKPEIHGRTDLSLTTNAAGGNAYDNLEYDDKDVWLLASGGFRGHTDYRDGGGDRIDSSAYRDGQVRIAGGFRPTEDLTVELSALRTEARDVGIPGGPSTLPTNGRVMYPRTTSTLVSADATLDVDGETLKELEGSVYYNFIERRVYVDNTGQAAIRNLQPAADHATLGGNLRSRSEFGDHTVIAGVDGWSWTMESLRRRYLANGSVLSDQPVPDARQTSLGVYAEDTYALAPDWTLNFGGRLDHLSTHNADNAYFSESDDNDLGWNLHAGATWQMGGPWSQNVLVGSSYRAADLLERFKYISLAGGVVLWGNPDLKPEQTLFAEWGLDYTTREFEAGVRIFGNKIHNYISERQVNSTTLEMTNIGEARIVGVELDGQWNFAPAWNLHGDVSAVDGRDQSADEPLRYIAPVSGKVGVGYRTDGWFASLDERWAAPQTRTPDGVDHVGGYATTHVAAGYAFDIGPTAHRVALSLDNLFDAKYRNYLANARGIDLVEPGFAATLTYSMEF